MRRFIMRLFTLTLPLLLSACISAPHISSSEKALTRVDLGAAAPAIGQARDAWPSDQWWLDFNDPQLNQLMQHALEHSPTLAIAQIRLRHAQAFAGFARSANGLQVSADAGVQYGRVSKNYVLPPPPFGPGGQTTSINSLAANLSYDLDLWGYNAAVITAANAQIKAAVFDRDAARLALTTSIARTYIQLAALNELRDVLLETQKQRQAIRTLTDRRVASGLDTLVEAKQAESNEVSLGTDIEQIQTDMNATRLQLVALAGDMPEAAAHIARPELMTSYFNVPPSLALDLLGRRPELAAQRARIEAALGKARAAKAQFYPNIELNGLVGLQSIGFGQLFSGSSLAAQIGPAIHLPLFDSGRLRANYALKITDVDAELAQYNQSVINAAEDVVEQLTRAASLAREEEANRAALAAAQESYNLAMLRYRGGLSPYLTVLTIESQLLAQRTTAVKIHAQSRDLQVSLVRALGGGFQEPAPSLVNNQTP